MTVAVPQLIKIDHVHLQVPSWQQAESWYQRVLGFKRVETLIEWAVDGGPLTISNCDHSIHLALFESKSGTEAATPARVTVAFAAEAHDFIQWQAHFDNLSVSYQQQDHQLSWSLYFNDPYDNRFEISCYDYQTVSAYIKDVNAV